jgi:hypothetical protein
MIIPQGAVLRDDCVLNAVQFLMINVLAADRFFGAISAVL